MGRKLAAAEAARNCRCRLGADPVLNSGSNISI